MKILKSTPVPGSITDEEYLAFHDKWLSIAALASYRNERFFFRSESFFLATILLHCSFFKAIWGLSFLYRIFIDPFYFHHFYRTLLAVLYRSSLILQNLSTKTLFLFIFYGWPIRSWISRPFDDALTSGVQKSTTWHRIVLKIESLCFSNLC